MSYQNYDNLYRQLIDGVPHSLLFHNENFMAMSSEQVNEYLDLLVIAVRNGFPLLKDTEEHEYYVFLGEGDVTTRLVAHGRVFDFYVEVPSLVYLRKDVISDGVPVDDAVAYTTAVENAFEFYLFSAYYIICDYSMFLSKLCALSSVTKEVLNTLSEDVHASMLSIRKQVKHAKTMHDQLTMCVNLMECQKQLQSLTAMLDSKNG